MKSTIYLLFALITILNVTHATEKKLKISSFNIKFYGTGGVYSGEIGDEYRDRWIKQFISENIELSSSDVIIFQEIVDIERLKNLISNQFNCISYNSSQNNHQYVVICHLDKYGFEKVNNDNNYIIDESALNKYRPAVYGTLTDKNGNKMVTIVGVHLKARDNSQEKRKKQIEIIATHLINQDSLAPIVIIGDFNTYFGDQEMISNQFYKLGLRHQYNFNQLTYNSGYFKSILDHAWIDNRFKDSTLTITGPCNTKEKETSGLENIYYFNNFVSDHCPITLTVNLAKAL